MIDNLDKVRVHTHIVIDTSIKLSDLQKKFIKVLGTESDRYFEEITKMDDKDINISYLVKQNKEKKYLTYKSYNFKIAMN